MEYLKNLPEILTEEKDTVGWMEDYDYPGSSCVYIACVLTAAGNRLEKCPVFPNLIWRNIDKKLSREAERTLSFSEYIHNRKVT